MFEVEELEEAGAQTVQQNMEDSEPLTEESSSEVINEIDVVETIEESKELDEVESIESLEEVEELEELDEVESIESLEEVETLEDVEDLEPLEEIETLEEVGAEISEPNSSESSVLEDTVNDLFKEDMVIGEKSIRKLDTEHVEDYFGDMDFSISSMDFSHLDDDSDEEKNNLDESSVEIDEDDSSSVVEMLEESAYSLVHKFFTSQDKIVELESVDVDTIVEESGIFVIPKDLEVKNENVNKEFKTLVDSVLK